MSQPQHPCPDCSPTSTPMNSSSVDRRDFLKTALLAGAAGRIAASAAASTSKPDSETLVATLYKSLTPEQRAITCMPFDHPLRSKVDNAWHITPKKIGELFNRDQQALISEIFRGLHNPDFVDKVMQHIKDDAGGLDQYSVALFGEPGGATSNKFEFVLTGRHCTVRCDGDSVDGAAFGGPIFYGHQAGPNGMEPADHPGNVFWYQARRANEVFAALDGKQRSLALVSNAPRAEKGTGTVALGKAKPEGLPVSEMSRDQQQLVEKVLADLLLPFRAKDAAEAMKLIRGRTGGIQSLSMAFYKNLDLGSDGVWDVWQLEGPGMVWYFRGHPHVHVWVNVKA